MKAIAITQAKEQFSDNNLRLGVLCGYQAHSLAALFGCQVVCHNICPVAKQRWVATEAIGKAEMEVEIGLMAWLS